MLNHRIVTLMLPVLTITAVLSAQHNAVAQAPAAPMVAQSVEPNDQRRPAGRVVIGERRIELDVVKIIWQPGGPKGPTDTTSAFAERGHTAQMPGPLMRLTAGMPVHVSVRNTLEQPVHLRGLSDRIPGDTVMNGASGFMRRDPLVLAPGETREVQFTPTSAVTSFYFAAVVRDPRQPPTGPDAGLTGAFVVDAAGTTVDPTERIFMITRWRTLSINGRVWPTTERLHYTEGERVHWRVINTSGEYHPMHLHGFYFTVNARGDTQADTVASTPRALQVTEGMREVSTMQLSWTAARAGNWLFHCHIVVHTQGAPPDSVTAAEAEHMSGMAMNDGMAGLIMGITVTPRVLVAKRPPTNPRRLDLWTGTRQKMFGDSVGYGFVLQRGVAAPAPDSITLPSSPLVLTRGEPTMIVVHNRLPVALSLHWHGIELDSYYDGVGNWSGAKGNIRAPIAAGDSMTVYMTPPRAGTFMYHIHGEAGAELQQGLYGALIVVDRGQTRTTTTDRLFVLGSRGAQQDVDAAINGHGLPPAERFDAGKRYRLRFMHISTNDVKNIRLLKDGAPVQWRPLARDGAALPVIMQRSVEAKLRMDVGQTFDMEWTPSTKGVYVLEIRTDFLTFPGPPMQRIAFAVGPASDNDLRVAATGTTLPLAELVSASLDKFMGAYGDQSTEFVSVWTQGSGLAMTRTVAGVESTPVTLIPLADGTFVLGTTENGFVKETTPLVRYRLDRATVVRDTADASNARAGSLSRIANLQLAEAVLSRYVGRYENNATVTLDSGSLNLRFPSAPPFKFLALSRSRFWFSGGGSPTLVEFVEKDGKVVTLIVAAGEFTAARLPDQ